MTETTVPGSLFGIPLRVERLQAKEVVEDLTKLWTRQMGHPPDRLEKDLDDLEILFDPLARGARIRRELAKLPQLPALSSALLQPPVVLGYGDELLITPEGRAVLEHLDELLLREDTDLVDIDPRAVYAVERQVYERYRRWSTKRLMDVLRLQAGDAQALPLPSVASVLLLLVNGSRSPETALRRFTKKNDDRTLRDDDLTLNNAVGAVVAAFCEALGAPQMTNIQHFSLYSGYAMTELRRRLSGVMGDNSARAYVLTTGEEKALKLVVAELSRPQRWFSKDEVLVAFDRLVDAYRAERPALAALGMAHEQRTETRALRKRLETALNERNSRP